ncbi:translation initiation factor IF-2 [Candidatus Peregrinibacteria bacterium]|nr:translation initiation factor IF-2 [Candidatus Peregrinibacteria bacterium]
MRLVQVAKVLGMTGQELRKELSKVDFGVKPTDREIPDSLAQGVIRYIARVRGITVDIESIFGVSEAGAPAERPGDEQQSAEPKEEEAAAPEAPAKEVNVLRKLTLEGVSAEAVAAARDSAARHSPAKPRGRADTRRGPAPQQARTDGIQHQEQIKRKEGIVSLPDRITVKEFAEKTGVQVPKVISVLMKNGVMATINQQIDYETAAIVAAELQVTVSKEEGAVEAKYLLSRNLEELLKDEPENLKPRPPIVVVMGHVDHGKTSILDAIRKTDVVKGEAGGITQHIGAYQIEYVPGGSAEKRKITFIDTPGHEAFAAMRARGAQVTDIVVLVVAADEGIKPTTVEAINHAKEAAVPVIVAINKIDKPAADPDRVKGELAGYGLQPEEWGGTVPTVLVSAVNGQGISTLLDSLLLMADIAELKANPSRLAVATVVESHLDQSLGALATLIVNAGTLRVGDIFVCGRVQGRVRTMTDEHGIRLEEAPPSTPVRISGIQEVVEVGDILQVVSSDQQAKQLLNALIEDGDVRRKRNFADLVTRLSEGKLKQLKIVLKADAQGSLDAIRDTLERKATDQVTVKIIHAAIGAVTETDVMMAVASDGIVVAFHAPVAPTTMRAAEREGVSVREYDVIYALFEDVDGLLKGLVEPVEDEKIFGHLAVKAVFMTKKSEQVIGGRVEDGIVKRLTFRILRNGQIAGTGRITSLRKVDKDIKEAAEGTECGMRIEATVPVQEGDSLEVYLRELKKKA